MHVNGQRLRQSPVDRLYRNRHGASNHSIANRIAQPRTQEGVLPSGHFAAVEEISRGGTNPRHHRLALIGASPLQPQRRPSAAGGLSQQWTPTSARGPPLAGHSAHSVQVCPRGATVRRCSDVAQGMADFVLDDFLCVWCPQERQATRTADLHRLRLGRCMRS